MARLTKRAPTAGSRSAGVDQAGGGVADDRGVEPGVARQLRIGPALAVVGRDARQRACGHGSAPQGSSSASSSEQRRAAADEHAEQAPDESGASAGQNWK